MLPERPWKLDAVARLVMLVLLSVSGSVLMMLIAARTVRSHLAPSDFEFAAQITALVCGQGLGLVWMQIFLREHDVTWAEAFGFRRAPARSAGIACAVMVIALPVTLLIMGTLVEPLMRFFGMPPEAQIPVEFLKKHPPAWQTATLGLLAVGVVPAAEEMFFRGVLYTTIKQRGYPRLAFWGTSALFGAIHFNIAAFIPLFFLAVIFTWLYERTGNLLAPITAHIVFNAVNFVALVADLPQWLEKTLKQ